MNSDDPYRRASSTRSLGVLRGIGTFIVVAGAGQFLLGVVAFVVGLITFEVEAWVFVALGFGSGLSHMALGYGLRWAANFYQ